MHSGRFFDVQVLCFRTALCCDMYYAILLEGPFDEAPELRFQCAERLNIGSAAHQ